MIYRDYFLEYLEKVLDDIFIYESLYISSKNNIKEKKKKNFSIRKCGYFCKIEFHSITSPIYMNVVYWKCEFISYAFKIISTSVLCLLDSSCCIPVILQEYISCMIGKQILMWLISFTWVFWRNIPLFLISLLYNRLLSI